MTNEEKAALFDWLGEHAESVVMIAPNVGVTEWLDGNPDTLADWLQGVKEASYEG